jgi:Rho-binding antiterminator
MSECSISCELHDYLEIACMYGYRVRLTIKNHQTIEGKAIDTVTTAEKREYLVIDNGQKKHEVELNQLGKMEVLTPNAKFKKVSFQVNAMFRMASQLCEVFDRNNYQL